MACWSGVVTGCVLFAGTTHIFRGLCHARNVSVTAVVSDKGCSLHSARTNQAHLCLTQLS